MIDFTILRIENTLLKKTEDFPKLMNKDNQSLRELWDLLIELWAAKTSGQLPGLSCLDMAHRVNPILTLRVYPAGHPEKAVKIYAVLKEHSNHSLAKTYFLTFLSLKDSLNHIHRKHAFACLLAISTISATSF